MRTGGRHLTMLGVKLLIAGLLAAPGTSPRGVFAQAPAKTRVEAPPPAGAPEVLVRAWPSRTALWIGDRVTYTVELRFGPRIDILADDLSRDKLRPEGLELVGYDAAREVAPDGGVVQTFRFELASFDVPRNGSSLGIGALPVRYYVKTAGRRPGDSAPAGEVVVPPLRLAWRSTIPDELESYMLRDLQPPSGFPRRLELASPLGWSLILVSTVPVLVGAAALVRRSRRPRAARRRKTRDARSVSRASLDALRRIDAASDEARREGYDRLDALLRSYVAESLGIPSASLTPAEIEAALGPQATDRRASAVAGLLAECELARYSRPAALPPPEQFERSVREAEKLVAGGPGSGPYYS